MNKTCVPFGKGSRDLGPAWDLAGAEQLSDSILGD